MIRTRLILKMVATGCVGAALMGANCLPDNFWAGTLGNVTNGAILGAINSALAATAFLRPFLLYSWLLQPA